MGLGLVFYRISFYYYASTIGLLVFVSHLFFCIIAAIMLRLAPRLYEVVWDQPRSIMNTNSQTEYLSSSSRSCFVLWSR